MDINTDRCCEACARDWRGDTECPTCGHINPLSEAEQRKTVTRDMREWEANEYDLPDNERFCR